MARTKNAGPKPPPRPTQFLDPLWDDPRLTPLRNLTVNDLIIFCRIYQAVRRNTTWKKLLSDNSIPPKTWTRISSALEEALPGNYRPTFTSKEARGATAGEKLHEQVTTLVEFLIQLIEKDRNRQTLRVHGSELSVLWLLPRVLADSDFKQRHPDVDLEIGQAPWEEALEHLLVGSIDLAFGPNINFKKPEYKQHLGSEFVLKLQRVLICHQDYGFYAGRPADKITLEDLDRETLFLLANNAIPRFHMTSLPIPPPKGDGRRIYVDSVSHMYPYVRQKVGVGIGYERQFDMLGSDTDTIRTIPLPELKDHPCEIYMFWAQSRQSESLTHLMNAVRAEGRSITAASTASLP